jgi:acetolactate synthase-1/3 small subunit
MGANEQLHHTLSVLVENQPGVLARVAGLFSRRGFNIESLAVGPTEREDRSRITLRVDCSQISIEQVVKQLDKLINVLTVSELEQTEAVERELLLAKVEPAEGARGELVDRAEAFGARLVDPGPGPMIFEMVAHPDRVAAFEAMLRPHGVLEAVRTGRVGLRRANAANIRPAPGAAPRSTTDTRGAG